MAKMECAKCGGTKYSKGGTAPKKMAKGGMPTKVLGPAKQPFAAGIPYFTGAGQTGPESMKKGGAIKKYAKGGSTAFGMLSVKAGIDKNPGKTFADKIAGAKMQKGGVTDLITRGATAVVKAIKDPTNNVNHAVADGINRGAISKITKAKKEGIVKGYNPTMSKSMGKGNGPSSKPQPTGQSTAQSKIKAVKSSGSKPMVKAQYGKIVKTAVNYIKPLVGAAKSGAQATKTGVKKVADTYKKVKAANYNKKTANLRRIEDWENFANQERAKKIARTGVIGLGGMGAAAAIADKYKSKKK